MRFMIGGILRCRRKGFSNASESRDFCTRTLHVRELAVVTLTKPWDIAVRELNIGGLLKLSYFLPIFSKGNDAYEPLSGRPQGFDVDRSLSGGV